MAKEKYLQYEKEKKDLTFYYEIIGIISIILPVLGFARLGIVGFYIMLIFKIIFGDWYFLFLLAIFCYGLRCLIYHKPMDLKRMRFIGICFILLGVMILSHFPMHKYIESFDEVMTGGHFTRTITLYLDYFKNYHDGMVVGGGLIGCCFFYLFYSLLSTIGTSFVILVLIFVGVVFFTERTISEFIEIFIIGFKNIIKFVKKRFNGFKYNIKVPEKRERVKHLNINDLKDSEGIKFIIQEEKKTSELKIKICDVLNKMNIFYNEVKTIIGYNVTTYLIDTIAFIDLSLLYKNLKEIIDSQFLIKKVVKTKQVIIEVNNDYESSLDVKTILNMNPNFQDDLDYPIGLTSMNETLIFNGNEESSILIEDVNNYSNSFIQAFLILNACKYKSKRYKYHIMDEDNLLNINCEKHKETFNIDLLIKNSNELLSALSEGMYNNIKEYNEKSGNVKKIKYQVFIFSKIENYLTEQNLEKFIFLMQVSQKLGYIFVFRSKNTKELPNVLTNYISTNLFFKDSVSLEQTKKIRNSEAFYINHDLIERITPISILGDEFNTLSNKI